MSIDKRGDIERSCVQIIYESSVKEKGCILLIVPPLS